mgnify:CR=1 FL=1
MGRGNVCVTGAYEGLYYIDNDHFHVYRRDKPDSDDEFQTRLMGNLSHEELTSGEWLYDEWGTEEEKDDILECFIESFTMMFPSFTRPAQERWLTQPGFGGRSRLLLLESKLFQIVLEDNEWSLAVELLQKEEPYDNHLSGLQERHYLKYLDGIKRCLLELIPSIGTYTGAWTSGSITREELITA